MLWCHSLTIPTSWETIHYERSNQSDFLVHCKIVIEVGTYLYLPTFWNEYFWNEVYGISLNINLTPSLDLFVVTLEVLANKLSIKSASGILLTHWVRLNNSNQGLLIEDLYLITEWCSDFSWGRVQSDVASIIIRSLGRNLALNFHFLNQILTTWRW